MECPHPLMSADQIKAWILRQLGAPRVKVELDLCHLNDAIEDALEWFMAWKGLTREKKFELYAGQVLYDPPDDADTILDVILPGSVNVSPAVFADQAVPYDASAAPETGGIYSSLYQAVQYSETTRRVLSVDFNWMWNEASRKIIVTPIPRVGGTGVIQYKSKCITIEQLTVFDYRLVKEYALARAKVIVGGRIRGKYGSFPTAQGDRDIQDSDRLMDEGQGSMEELTELLRNSCYPMPFVTG